MKKLYLFLLVFLFSHVIHAQYCGNSGPLVCSQTGTMTQPSLSPSSSQLTPLSNGQLSSVTIQIMAPDSLRSIGVEVTETIIDSITNLPSGMCWATNKVGNKFGTKEKGCIVLSGLPCSLNGQYLLQIHMTVKNSLFPFHMVNGSGFFNYNCFLRVKNGTDPATSVDTTQTYSNPFIPYGTIPACASFKRFEPSLWSSSSVCEGGNIMINFLSRNMPLSSTNRFFLELSGYDIHLGNYVYFYTDSIQATSDGIYSFRVPDSLYRVECSNPPSYELYFHSTDTAITYPIGGGIRVYERPQILNVTSQRVCANTPLTLGSPSPIFCSLYYSWYHLPDTVPFANSPEITFNGSLTGSFKLRVDNGVCYTDTLFSLYLNPSLPLPIMDTLKLICPGDSTKIGPTSINANYTYYAWSNTSGYFSWELQPTVSSNQIETYTLSVSDTSNCVVTKDVIVAVKFPPIQAPCMITVDPLSTHTVLIWEKNDKYATDSFLIYREVTTGMYTQIASIPRDSLSEYHDLSANPNTTGYRYKMAVRDTCGNIGLQSLYHNSIHLQYLGAGNLQWNGYEIESSTTPVSSYDIFRDSSGNGTWQKILNVSGSQQTATDPNYSMYQNAKYRVKANWTYPCSSSRSLFNDVISNTITNKVNSISTIEKPLFEISPNPTKGLLNVSSMELSSGNIIISDMTGNVLNSFLINKEIGIKINIDEFASGLYILKYITNEGVFSQKIIKQ
ncbi:MAG: T9SS type A sorting domain-containing protein [Chitinophagales bacterium]|nr:T9SS type A sorting domain-containing protein [Chitinophagales bacterium]